MKNKNGIIISLITLLLIGVNLAGKWMTQELSLPVWLDSVGTVAMGYYSGPYCAAVVGFTSNIVYGTFVDTHATYSLVGLVIGVIVGILSKKKVFSSVFGAMSLGIVLAIECTVFSCFLNIMFYHGMTGNVWGDQICEMYNSYGVKRVISYVIGQFYIEFLDKIITVMFIYAITKIVASYKRVVLKKANIIIMILITGAMTFGVTGNNVMADEQAEDYGAYTQSTYAGVEGLSVGVANGIEQTKDGVLWIGTYAGLYSYDGIKFVLHSEYESVKNVNELYVDEEGRLWIGTNDDGLSITIEGEIINVIDDTNGLPSNSVRCINRNSEGKYYIGTSKGIGIVSLNGGVKLVDTMDDVIGAISMSADLEGNLFVVTENGTLYVLNGEKVVKTLNMDNAAEVFNACYWSDDGFLYVGTSLNHVRKYSYSSGEFKLSEEYTCAGVSNINSFYKTERNELFVCSDSGIGYFTENFEYIPVNTNMFDSSVKEMLVDYQGNLWFASSRLGLLKLCKSSFTEVFSEAGLEEEVVNSVTRWKDMLVFGTDNGLKAVGYSDRTVVSNELTERFENIRIRCLLTDSNKNLWIATMGNGFYKVNTDDNGQYNIMQYSSANGTPGDRFRCIIELKDGTIAAAGNDGIVYVKDDDIVKVYNSESDIVNVKTLCLYESQDGKVYAGSDGGGISVLDDGKVIKNINRSNGLSSDVILRMVYDKKSEGIIVVTSNGLCYINKSGKIYSLSEFPYSNNYDVISDGNGSSWVLGSAGIYIVDTEKLINNKKTDYELLNEGRGLRVSLTANAWNYTDEDGNLYLSCDAGACMINMYKYDEDGKSYRMLLDRVKVDGKYNKINRVDTLKLDSDITRLEFEPKILNYSLNDPYISYYLEGFDTKPNVVPLSELETITYTNLDSGKYVFHISVLNDRKTKTLEIGSYTFVKREEMYQKWWFKVYTTLVSALAIAWVSWFITRSRTQKKIVTQQLELEYAKKQIQMGNETIISIARTVDAKDPYTSQHSIRVAQYSEAIAKRYGFDEKRCENLRQIAMLHDIGKIGIPDAILNKPAKLTDEEYDIMKTHVLKGGEILNGFTLINNVAVGALYHHERYDGKGYCAGLKGREIPIEARIIGIADTFDAMTRNRVYRKKLDMDYVINELKRCSGTQFDPELVEIMMSLIEDGTINVEELYQQKED